MKKNLLFKSILNLSFQGKLYKLCILLFFSSTFSAWAQTQMTANKDAFSREKISMDANWRFAFGNPLSTDKDFTNGTSYFSYFAKAGYGDGAASKTFDDRAWRNIDLPHDWVAELPFDSKGTHSHGYKAVGRNFPESSVGWYRKTINIPESDLGKRISIDFDGVFRNSVVWVNGFYLGQEQSGYADFSYDITDYLNYGGNNVIAVRVDATMEEGWFYEGAGIYRHTWLTKTAPLHVARHGTFVVSDVKDNAAIISIKTNIVNNANAISTFDIEQNILDADGKSVGTTILKQQSLKVGAENEFSCSIDVQNPKLWSIETPYLHKLITIVKSDGKVIDRYETPFGIRTIRFDANEGFFLNGKNVKIKGTNNHQDHAGVGVAIPDALQDFRIKSLKEMGCNAYRTSHNPPTPEMLDACDRLGMLVLVENRLMGSNQEHFDLLKRMIVQDRNHPSVILWSMGNEEWAIEGNVTGNRIAASMQAFAQNLDPSRRITTAISGGWGVGISSAIDVMGFNYLTHGNIDDQHKKFPNQPAVGTEETTTSGTRGVYVDDKANGRMAATDRTPGGANTETGWKYFDARPFLAGLFYWTGFDYRGEPNPLSWPAVSSQFGIIDACGFPKDAFYYLKSVWTNEPVLHLLPHWNWKGSENKDINVWAYSNCDSVELFLNKKSQGRKPVPKNSHIEWIVKYQPGVLFAQGYKNGKKSITQQVETTGDPVSVQLLADRSTIKADGKDVSVLTVTVKDKKGLTVPVSSNEVTFTIEGPGKIIGVGNGDPGSHEPDKFIPSAKSIKITNWISLDVDNTENRTEINADFNDSAWPPAFRRTRNTGAAPAPVATPAKATVYRARFELKDIGQNDSITLMLNNLGEKQSIYVNGQIISKDLPKNDNGLLINIPRTSLHVGSNVIAVVALPLIERRRNASGDPGSIQILTPSDPWKRKVFNGLAQVIVQSTEKTGDIILKANAPGLTQAIIKLHVGE
jgi:beta-galactosidase